MFKLLSKESNIFSVPVYIGVLLGLIFLRNISSAAFSVDLPLVFALGGLALGYFCINSIRLNYQTHVPLFLYTVFSLVFFSMDMDIGLSVALMTNSLLVLMLSSPEDMNVKKNYVIVGGLLVFNYIFLPATWAMILFVIIHVFATSERIVLHIFRLFFGMVLMGIFYFSLAYFFGANTWDERYLPMPSSPFLAENFSLVYLSPIAILLLWAIADHFLHYNEKSPVSRYKYTFLLLFLVVQVATILMYMENSKSYLLLLVMPMSIIFARFLRFRKRYWEKEVGLGVIMLTLLVYFTIEKVMAIY